MLYDQLPAWYAIRTQPNHERITAAIFANKRVPHFLPTYRTRSRWHDRTKNLERPLFPGYLFAHMDYSLRPHVLATPSVLSILSHGRHETPIPDSDIEAIRRLMASGIPLSPWPNLVPGQRVRILHGPLEGLAGTLIRAKNLCRMVVSIPLLQRSIAAEIDIESLAAA
jgi:transcription antitermination factor NusG